MAQSNYAPLAELQAAIDEFRAVLTPQEATAFDQAQKPSTQDVLDMTAQIDKHKSKKGFRRLGTRYLPLLQSVQQFTGVVDTFIQADPKISALVWGSLKFAIQVVFNFFDYFDKISEMFQKLGCLCPVLQRNQQLFPESVELQRALSSLYAIVVRFCSSVVSFLHQNQFKQFAKTVWRPFKLQFQQTESDLELKKQVFDSELRVAEDTATHKERQAAALYRYEGTLHREKAVEEWRQSKEWRLQHKKQREREEKEALLATLSDYDYTATYDRACAQRCVDTCQWVTGLDPFKSWMTTESSSVLWLHGIPGAGKSIITTSVVEYIWKTTGGKTDIGICYFMNDFSSRESLDVRTVLRCLSRQLLSTRIHSIPTDIADMLKSATSLLRTSEASLQLLKKVIRLHRAAFIILDGIDEMPEGNRLELLHLLDNLIEKSLGCLNIFISSRRSYSTGNRAIPRNAVEISLNHDSSMTSTSLISDIRHYVQKEMETMIHRGRLTLKSPTLQKEIEDALVSKSDGMFLWVNFQLHEISKQNNDEDIRKVLATLPKGLGETYQRILHRILEERNPKMAQKVFTWLSVVIRPITLEELSEAITIDPGDTSRNDSRRLSEPCRILEDCEALVRYAPGVNTTGTVHFAHFTVLEYLRSDNLTPPLNSFKVIKETATLDAAEICLTYLSFGNFQTQIARIRRNQPDVSPLRMAFQAISPLGKPWRVVSRLTDWFSSTPTSISASDCLFSGMERQRQHLILEGLSQSYPFMSYAQHAWMYHSSDAFELQDGCGIEISTKFSDLLERTLCVPHLPWSNDGSISALTEWAFEHDLPGILLHFIEQIKKQTRYKTSTLILTEAIRRVRFRIVTRFLYIEGFDDWEAFTCYLVSEGHAPFLKAMINHPQDFSTKQYETIIFTALEMDQRECLDALLSCIEVHETWSAVEFCLSVAAKRVLPIGSWVKAILHRLELDNMSQMDPLEKLLHAVYTAGFHPNILEYLVNRGINLNAKNGKEETVLYLAAISCQPEVVRLLIEAGADVNVSGGECGNALYAAASSGHEAVVRLLVEAGADISVPDGRYGSALHAAAFSGHEAVVRLLVEAGADISVPNGGYGNALCAAAFSGHEAVVRLLIEAGADVDALGGMYGSALYAAASRGHEAVVRLLIEAGADISVPGGRYGNALYAAASSGHEAVVRLLIEAGADVNVGDKKDTSALYWAAFSGHEAVVRLLIDAGADVDARDEEDPSALYAAASRGHEAVVRLLVEAGADVNIPDGEYGSALHAAASSGHEAVVRLLVEAGADANAWDKVYGTAVKQHGPPLISKALQ